MYPRLRFRSRRTSERPFQSRFYLGKKAFRIPNEGAVFALRAVGETVDLFEPDLPAFFIPRYVAAAGGADIYRKKNFHFRLPLRFAFIVAHFA